MRMLGAQEIIGPDAQVEEVSRSNARRVMVVAHRSVRRNPQTRRAAIGIHTTGPGCKSVSVVELFG